VNPFEEQALGSVVRVAIVWIAVHLGHTITNDEAAHIAVEYVVPVLVLAWSLWQKYRGRQKLLTAASLPLAVSERQVENVIKSGGAASVTTPKSVIPQQKVVSQ
jgi:hypothetical protein